MRFRPARRILHELLRFLELGFVELAATLGRFQNVPPGRKSVQCDAEVAQDLFALGKDVIEEHDETMLNDCTGTAQSLAKIDLAAAVGRHVLDQQHPVAGFDMPLDLSVASETL